MEKKQSETTRSVARNVLYGFSTWILPLGLSFIATPAIVKALGNQDYGLYALVLGFVGYSFNFSFGRSVTKYIAEYRAAGEAEKIPDIISTAFLVNIIVGMLSVSIMCLSANWFVSQVFKIDAASQNKTVIALYIASMIIFFMMQNQIFTAILQGIHRFDVYSKIFNLNNFAVLTGNLLLAIGGYGLLSLLVWNLAVTCLTGFIFAITAKRLLPEFKFNFKIKGAVLKLIIRYSAGVIGYQILSNFLLLFERGWIIRQLGAETLTYYVIPMMLTFNIHGFISSLIIVIFPLASELKNEPKKLLRLYTKATKIVCLFVFFMATTLITESKFFLTLWMGAEFADKTALLLILHTITFSLVAILAVSWQMTEGLGYPGFNCYVYVINLFISVFFMVYLTPFYGVFGIAIGRMSGFAITFFAVFYIEKWFLGRVQTELWLKAVGVLTISAAASAIVEKFCIENLSINWLSLAAATLFGGLVYCSVLWFLGFIREDEKLLFRNLINR